MPEFTIPPGDPNETPEQRAAVRAQLDAHAARFALAALQQMSQPSAGTEQIFALAADIERLHSAARKVIEEVSEAHEATAGLTQRIQKVLPRLRAVNAVRRHLEAMEVDEEVRADPPVHAAIRKALAAMPHYLHEIDASSVMKALALPSLSATNSTNASKIHKTDAYEKARRLYDAEPGARPLSKAVRAGLKKRILAQTEVVDSTVRIWLNEFEGKPRKSRR